jgi:hypothetical protein
MSSSVLQELLSRLAFTLVAMTLVSCQAVLGIEDVSIRADAGGDLPDSDVPDVPYSRVCPDDFTEEHGDHRYFISLTGLYYDEAVAECFDMDGHLAVVDDVGENDFLAGLLTADSWIGYDDLIKEGRFDWITGVEPGFYNWKENEPNDNGSGEDCIGMVGPQSIAPLGQWNDYSCGNRRGYICECDPALEPRPVPSCMTDPAYDRILEGRRYRWTGTTATWQEARELCLEDGADLVVISDQHEQARIAATITNSIWLGLGDRNENGVGPFEWVIGDATYFNWASGQPDNAGGSLQYAIMHDAEGAWYDRLGSETHNVMCECDPKSPPRNY